MTTDRVMLLIDADNVSVDVMEQAVRLLLNQHGALHVRRAYCTAEGALKHQSAFKRLGIKPMVNLAAGKNSTDIALAVDAIDLVLAERPDVVVIASSDSDFAPLVQRLREKGCVVRGIGQQGKTGDETRDVYDDFTVLEHRKPSGAASPATAAHATPPDKPARKTAARKAPAKKAASTPAKKAAAKPAARTAAKVSAKAEAAAVAAPPPDDTPAPEPAAKPARKAPRSRAAAKPAADTVAAPPPVAPPPAAPASGGRALPLHEQARQILACMPELQRGETLELRVASQRLREAGLLGRSGASTKLLGQFPELFELLPQGQPNHLRMRR
jgi:uncharacterized protein (TIGR00288 family)